MLRTATWSLLVILLLTTQVFSVACGARCGRVAIVGSNGHSSLTRQQISGVQSVITSNTAGPCMNPLCKDDWAFLKSPVAVSASLDHSILPVPAQLHVIATLQHTVPVRVRPKRSTQGVHSIPDFEPAISSLRI
jgi:hypothetical protein